MDMLVIISWTLLLVGKGAGPASKETPEPDPHHRRLSCSPPLCPHPITFGGWGTEAQRDKEPRDRSPTSAFRGAGSGRLALPAGELPLWSETGASPSQQTYSSAEP